ncbi:MAG: glycosyltransferase [Mycobacteriales bacterium]
MRLAVIVPAPTLQLGGVQRFATELVRALGAHADVVPFRVHPAGGQSRVRAAIDGWSALRTAHRADRFDAVLTTFHWPARLWPVPTYGVVHDLRPWRQSPRWHPRLVAQRLVCSTWQATLVPSAHVGEDVERLLGGPRVLEIGEGADHLPLVPAQHPRDRIVVLGGRAAHKRVALGAAAAATAARRLGCGPPVVVGGAAQSLPADVERMTSPSDQELAALFARARVAVAATAYEGFGLAVAEALHAGVPVVWCRDSTLGALVGDGGVCAAPEVTALTEAVLRAWAHGAELVRAAQQAVSPHTWDATAQRVMAAVTSGVRTSPT